MEKKQEASDVLFIGNHGPKTTAIAESSRAIGQSGHCTQTTRGTLYKKNNRGIS